MPHDCEVICDERNNTPKDIENNMLNVDIVPPAGWVKPTTGWVTLDEAQAQQMQAYMCKQMGISPEFLTEDVPVETRITMAPKYSPRVAAIKKEVEATMRRLVKKQLKPKAVRGGAVLRYSLKKFRSLRLARVWWKQTLASSQNFSWDSLASDDNLVRTVEVLNEGEVPGVIPHIYQTTLVTDTYRKPNNEQ
jgi:hypothetical protein